MEEHKKKYADAHKALLAATVARIEKIIKSMVVTIIEEIYRITEDKKNEEHDLQAMTFSELADIVIEKLQSINEAEKQVEGNDGKQLDKMTKLAMAIVTGWQEYQKNVFWNDVSETFLSSSSATSVLSLVEQFEAARSALMEDVDVSVGKVKHLLQVHKDTMENEDVEQVKKELTDCKMNTQNKIDEMLKTIAPFVAMADKMAQP